LFEPETIQNQSGLPFRVFTPFWRKCLQESHTITSPAATTDHRWYAGGLHGDKLEHWSLTPRQPDWAAEWGQWWQPGEAGARHKLQHFLAHGLVDYSDGRDHPALECTARLSAHLHYGEISPRHVWHTAQGASAGGSALESQAQKFLSELGWREFSHHLLHHFPEIPERAFKPNFHTFPWLSDDEKLHAWQTGQTGYPMVDAGMRELWNTGFMHNRVRMITASFLTKHLLIHWRQGARWFWDTLVDADLANNSCGWQWVAGSGADASPYFRIFNPITQGKKFDAEGTYIRRWVPELAKLPDKYLNCPWEAPQAVLEQAGVTLGATYPIAIVDHKAARESALAAYGTIRA
jgi:deoxyribodipyrimidine photo-lyase